MPTPASITLNHLESSVDVTISHDGYPDTVLGMLASFLEQSAEAQTVETLEALYMKLYETLPEAYHGVMGVNTTGYGEWDYEITSERAVKVFKQVYTEGVGCQRTLVDPMTFVDSMMPDYQAEVKALLQAVMARICEAGFHIVVPQAKAA